MGCSEDGAGATEVPWRARSPVEGAARGLESGVGSGAEAAFSEISRLSAEVVIEDEHSEEQDTTTSNT